MIQRIYERIHITNA